MKRLTLLAIAFVLTSAAYAQTAAASAPMVLNADRAHSKLGFTVTHLSISEVDGSFNKFDAKVTTSKEDFSDAVFVLTADMREITTGNSGRDGHLKKPEMFNVDVDSMMTFKSTSITKVADKKYTLKGDLNLKGVTKSVTLDLTLLGTTTSRDGKKIAGFKASGTINRKDFGVGSGMPNAMLSENVELRASGEFK